MSTSKMLLLKTVLFRLVDLLILICLVFFFSCILLTAAIHVIGIGIYTNLS